MDGWMDGWMDGGREGGREGVNKCMLNEGQFLLYQSFKELRITGIGDFILLVQFKYYCSFDA